MSYQWIRAVCDQVVSNSPVWISQLIITPSSSSKRGDCTLYDGESASDPEILTVMSASGVTHELTFTPPLKTKRGLYLDYGGDTQEVIIQFSTEGE